MARNQMAFPCWSFQWGATAKTTSPTDIPVIYNREPHQAMCSTTPASIYLSQQLQIVNEILQKNDNELYTLLVHSKP